MSIGGIAGESLQHDEFCGEAEDCDSVPGGTALRKAEKLLVDEHLVLERGVQGIEQQDVDARR